MIAELKDHFIKEGCLIEEALITSGAEIPFWHSAVIGADQFPVSGGFSENRLNARKIAVSEFLERSKYRELCRSEKSVLKKWGLDRIPTACGFAAGFDKTNTVIRSMAEAVERWVMSKWIDDGLFIEQIPSAQVENELDPVSRFFAEKFDSVLFFKKNIIVDVQSSLLNVTVAQTMGLKSGGIFPGSSAQVTGGSIWQHSLLESYRHLLMVRNNPDRGDVFPDNKIRFFARNDHVALKVIARAKKKEWPMPSIGLHFCEHFDNSYFVARTILNGWKSWHEGPIERFLY